MFSIRKKFNNLLLISLSNRYTHDISYNIIKKILNQTTKNSLNVDGITIKQTYDKYNNTFLNERSIEVPLSKYLIKKYSSQFKSPKVLEIGNTLVHYENDNKIDRKVVDRYEKYQNVINEDIEEFESNHKFDLIFSISTLEHVGSDYGELKEEEKFLRVIDKIKNLLNEGGVFIITLPIFYREHVDKYNSNNNDFTITYFLTRDNYRNDWKLSNKDFVFSNKNNLVYNSKYPCANSVYIGIMFNNRT